MIRLQPAVAGRLNGPYVALSGPAGCHHEGRGGGRSRLAPPADDERMTEVGAAGVVPDGGAAARHRARHRRGGGDAGQGRKTDATDAHSVALVATRISGLRPVADDQQLAVLSLGSGSLAGGVGPVHRDDRRPEVKTGAVQVAAPT